MLRPIESGRHLPVAAAILSGVPGHGERQQPALRGHMNITAGVISGPEHIVDLLFHDVAARPAPHVKSAATLLHLEPALRRLVEELVIAREILDSPSLG